jgi:hypothetical protein
VLKSGDKLITIRAMKKGTVETLASETASGGVRIGGKITTSKVETSARGTSNTSTASVRASEAASDLDWAE